MTNLVQFNPDNPDEPPGQQATEFRNELVAYDGDTGEESWRTGMVDGRLLSIVPTEDDQLVALQPANPNGRKESCSLGKWRRSRSHCTTDRAARHRRSG